MDQFSRRIFLKVSGAAAVTPAAVGAAAQSAANRPRAAASQIAAAGGRPYLFFSAAEAAFIEAAADRLIPPDSLGPGAREAGVPAYMDQQLAGAWGAGERLYRSGPWRQGTPSQGYQLPFTPAELFRNAMRGAAAELQREGKSFDKLEGAAQDAYLTRLQNGTHDLEGVPAKIFFESLLAMTIEGYFCDPAYGGNQGMGAWAMIGFPGAYGNYYEMVDRHGVAFNVPPRSLAQDGGGHVHAMPATPAAGLSRGTARAPKGGR
jgi:gluconate 2-dehydrogenase gamma chain